MKSIRLQDADQIKIISFLTYTQSVYSSQKELEVLLDMISPSLKLIVLSHIFHSVMHEKTIFKNNPDLINYITSKLDTKIYQPEVTILS